MLKIGSTPYPSGATNYYSVYGFVTYNGNLNRPCLLMITEEEVNQVITAKVNKYVQPGVGVIAMQYFKLKCDTCAAKKYVLTEKWELKDYYLYP